MSDVDGPDLAIRQVWVRALSMAAGVVAVDQVTKSWAEDGLSDRVVHVVGSLQLALTYNRGVAFGLGAGVAPILVAVAIVGMLLVLIGKQIHLSRGAALAVGLVLGGAVGNVCDRTFRGHGGAVVDFIDLQWWPVFNVADAAIVVGALALVLWGSRKPKESE